MILPLLLFAAVAMAVPAKRQWRSFTQPDGSQIKLMLVGDESMHYYLTEDRVPVVQDNDSFCYAEAKGFAIRSTGVLAHEKKQRKDFENSCIASVNDIETMRQYAIKKGPKIKNPRLIGEEDHPSYKGKKKGLIILCNFTDKKFSEFSASDGGADTWEYYDQLANTKGYTNEDGAIGSVHDYFLDQSYNLFDLTFDVVGPIELDNSSTYYGEDFNGEDLRVPAMIQEACEKVDDEVDFNDYDWDDDGEVEEVFVIYAGYGTATGGSSSLIWPHMWTFEEASQYTSYTGICELPSFDGCTVNVYACSNECNGSWGSEKMGIGVICHEFSHCLGLPDMYDTGYHGSYGMDDWDLLDHGSYNGPKGIGWVPAGYTSYERNYAGWLRLTELKNDRLVLNQKPLNERGNAYVMHNDGYRDEYYLLENRNQTRWDEYIPGSGLLIIYVDYDADIWASNKVNTVGNTNDHPRMTPVRIGSRYSGSYTFPTDEVNSFSDDTTPSPELYHDNIDGTRRLNKAITNITRNDEKNTITFLFTNNNSETSGIAYTEQDNDDSQAEYYSLDGRQVTKPTSGIYLKHTKNGTKKILVR